ncbi:LysR family transcriptional regulator [Sinimarinibacterium thermocellulolyticum]|uniref:HTH-type transcriptional regulator MetR n=1 Tax=Sinimarinibacterium thermocellulolyticum TaxID=3170016 RepID=A0ABV2A7I1_9GAMM
MPSMLELRHLRTLLALRDTGSLSKSAERLHLTQSALSHQLRMLETQYGTPLVERDARPLRFTAAGRRLMELAQTVLPQVEDAERHIAQLVQGAAGQLRIAVECHTCFDWLMPAMDAFRERWPDVEMDLVSGFQSDVPSLLERGAAELVIVHDRPRSRPGTAFLPLFRYECVALMSPKHPLTARQWLRAQDFADSVLITYPVPDEMLDVFKHLLTPAGIKPRQRTAELTVAILQLVASNRGIAALPRWSVQPYLQRGYVAARRIGREGLWCELHAAIPASLAGAAYVQEFVQLIRDVGLKSLEGTAMLA